MKPSADPDPEELLRQAHGGNGSALGRLLEMYRNYLAVLARLQIGHGNLSRKSTERESLFPSDINGFL